MKIKDLMETANVQVVVSLTDLKELVMELTERNQQRKSDDLVAPAEKYLTTKEVAERLGVDTSTLWRWDKIGYLRKNRIGSKVRYKESDILKLMEG